MKKNISMVHKCIASILATGLLLCTASAELLALRPRNATKKLASTLENPAAGAAALSDTTAPMTAAEPIATIQTPKKIQPLPLPMIPTIRLLPISVPKPVGKSPEALVMDDANTKSKQIREQMAQQIAQLNDAFKAASQAVDQSATEQIASLQELYAQKAQLLLLEAEKDALKTATWSNNKFVESSTGKALIKEAKQKKISLKNELNNQIRQIHANAKLEKNQRKEMLAQDVARLKEEVEKVIAEVMINARQEAYEKALEARESLIAAMPMDVTVTQKIPLTEAERDIARNEFKSATEVVEAILREGIEDDQERKSFLRLLENLNNSFDDTVTRTDFVGDQHYLAYTKQKNKIESLVAAQKQADALLRPLLERNPLSESNKKRLRYKIFEKINEQLSMFPQGNTKPNSTIILDIRELQIIVSRSFEDEIKNMPECEYWKQQARDAQKDLEATRVKHESTLKTLEATITETTKKLETQLQEKSAAHEKTAATLDETQQKLDESQAATKEALQQASAAHGQQLELQERLDTIQADINRLSKERDTLLAEQAVRIKEIVELKAQLDQMSKDRSSLQNRIAECEKQVTVVEIEKAKVTAEKTILTQQIALAQSLLESTKEENKSLEIKIERQAGQNAQSAQKMADLMREHETKTAIEKALTDKLEMLSQQLGSTKAEMRNLDLSSEKKIVQLKLLQDHSTDSTASLMSQIERLKNEHSRMESELNQAQAHINSQNNTIGEAKAKILEAERSLSRTQIAR